MLEYVHSVPGRLRLKISELRDLHHSAEAEAYVAAIPVVNSVVANPATGSLTIKFEKSDRAAHELWNRLCARGYASGALPEPATVRSVPIGNPRGNGLGRAVLAAILEAVVQRSAQALVHALL